MLSMIGHRHFSTPYETDLQIHCLTYRSTVDAPQAASSCARICSKLRSSQRSRSRSHAVGNDRYAHWRRPRRRRRSSAFPLARRTDDVCGKAACGRRTRRQPCILISAKAHGKHERAIASATATFATKPAPAPPRSGETCMPFRSQPTHSAMAGAGERRFLLFEPLRDRRYRVPGKYLRNAD